MTLTRGRRIWLGLVLATVVVWLIADSQGPDLLAFNATGTFKHVLEVVWVLSLLGFILLVLFGIFSVVRSQFRRSKTS
jgi:heme/copper-type cytochrome/quinol oxidase subunit 3